MMQVFVVSVIHVVSLVNLLFQSVYYVDVGWNGGWQLLNETALRHCKWNSVFIQGIPEEMRDCLWGVWVQVCISIVLWSESKRSGLPCDMMPTCKKIPTASNPNENVQLTKPEAHHRRQHSNGADIPHLISTWYSQHNPKKVQNVWTNPTQHRDTTKLSWLWYSSMVILRTSPYI